jgi:hypothetical protein
MAKTKSGKQPVAKPRSGNGKGREAPRAKVHDAEMTVGDLQHKLAEARTSLGLIRKAFSEARRLPSGDRRRSQGRMGKNEAVVLRGVVDAMDEAPEVFSVLANEDDGHDPGRLETDLLRDRLDRHEVYSSLADELEELAAVMSDTALSIASQVKPVTLAGYEIAKPLSKRLPAIREKIAPALDYYGGNAAAGQATRKAKKAADKPAG